jgi:hypothetical protein
VSADEFGGHNDLRARNLERLENTAQGLFCLAESVHLGSVEEVDTCLESFLDDGSVQFIILRVNVDHVAKTDKGDLEPCVSQVTILHIKPKNIYAKKDIFAIK